MVGVNGTITGAAEAAGMREPARNTLVLSAGTRTVTRPNRSARSSPPPPSSGVNRPPGV